MTRNWVSALALTAGLMAATPVHASEKQDFERCDGLIHPARAADGMRGEAATPFYLRGNLGGADIAACDRAIASPRLLPTQTLRRAHLLRARAAQYLQVGNVQAALADLDAATAATADRANDRFYKRSMGISLDLLRALAHLKGGNTTQAQALARNVMAERPYSSQVQSIAAQIVHAAGASGEGTSSPFAMAVRLEPDALGAVLVREGEAGNFRAVLALRPDVKVEWPKTPLTYASLLGSNGDKASFLPALLISFHTAYAKAALNDPSGARSELATIRAKVQELKPAMGKGALATLDGPLATALDELVAARAKQVETRIAIAEGRHSDALQAMVGASLPKDAATAELIAALKASAPAKDAGLVPDAASFQSDAAKRRVESLDRLIKAVLIAPETPRSVVDYSRSRPNILGALVGGALSMGTSLLGGISRTDGFRSTPNPDGTIKVEFIGNTPSPLLVQEMTLLRAAEVARAAGKPAFVIEDRKDYTRVMQMSQYGSVISSRPAGYKTELTIRPLDTLTGSRALDATAVIDGLGPLYYEDKLARR